MNNNNKKFDALTLVKKIKDGSLSTVNILNRLKYEQFAEDVAQLVKVLRNDLTDNQECIKILLDSLDYADQNGGVEQSAAGVIELLTELLLVPNLNLTEENITDLLNKINDGGTLFNTSKKLKKLCYVSELKLTSGHIEILLKSCRDKQYANHIKEFVSTLSLVLKRAGLKWTADYVSILLDKLSNNQSEDDMTSLKETLVTILGSNVSEQDKNMLFNKMDQKVLKLKKTVSDFENWLQKLSIDEKNIEQKLMDKNNPVATDILKENNDINSLINSIKNGQSARNILCLLQVLSLKLKPTNPNDKENNQPNGKALENYLVGILQKLSDGQSLNDTLVLVDYLANFEVDNLRGHIVFIFQKIKDFSLSEENLKSILLTTKELSYAFLPDLIFQKIEDSKQWVGNMTKLVKMFINEGCNLGDCIDTIFKKIQYNNQSLDDMLKFVNMFIENGYNLNNHIGTIFQKIQDNNQAFFNMLTLVNMFIKKGYDLNNHIGTIFKKLKDNNQSFGEMSKLVDKFIEKGYNLGDCIDTIFKKIQDNDQSVGDMSKLVDKFIEKGYNLGDCIDTIFKKIKDNNPSLDDMSKLVDKFIEKGGNLANYIDVIIDVTFEDLGSKLLKKLDDKNYNLQAHLAMIFMKTRTNDVKTLETGLSTFKLEVSFDNIYKTIPGNQSVQNISNLVDNLLEMGYDLNNHIDTIFQKIKDDNQDVGYMSKLVNKLLDRGYKLNGCIGTIFEKIKNDAQFSSDMSELVDKFIEKEYNLEDHIDTIFKKLKDDNQDAGDMSKLVDKLLGKNYNLENHIDTIFKKIKDDNQDAGDMSKLVDKLLGKNYNLTNYIGTIFKKIKDNSQYSANMSKLVDKLLSAKCNLNDHIGTIFQKIRDKGQRVDGIVELVKKLSKYNLNGYVKTIKSKVAKKDVEKLSCQLLTLEIKDDQNNIINVMQELESKSIVNLSVDYILDSLNKSKEILKLSGYGKNLTAIFSNLAGNQSVDNILKLVDGLGEKLGEKYKLDDYLGVIFSKLKDDQSVEDILKLVGGLGKKLGEKYKLDDYLGVIFSKLAGNQSVDNILKLVGGLGEKLGEKYKLDDYLGVIFSKLAGNQSVDNILKLVGGLGEKYKLDATISKKIKSDIEFNEFLNLLSKNKKISDSIKVSLMMAYFANSLKQSAKISDDDLIKLIGICVKSKPNTEISEKFYYEYCVVSIDRCETLTKLAEKLSLEQLNVVIRGFVSFLKNKSDQLEDKDITDAVIKFILMLCSKKYSNKDDYTNLLKVLFETQKKAYEETLPQGSPNELKNMKIVSIKRLVQSLPKDDFGCIEEAIMSILDEIKIDEIIKDKIDSYKIQNRREESTDRAAMQRGVASTFRCQVVELINVLAEREIDDKDVFKKLLSLVTTLRDENNEVIFNSIDYIKDLIEYHGPNSSLTKDTLDKIKSCFLKRLSELDPFERGVDGLFMGGQLISLLTNPERSIDWSNEVFLTISSKIDVDSKSFADNIIKLIESLPQDCKFEEDDFFKIIKRIAEGKSELRRINLIKVWTAWINCKLPFKLPFDFNQCITLLQKNDADKCDPVDAKYIISLITALNGRKIKLADDNVLVLINRSHLEEKSVNEILNLLNKNNKDLNLDNIKSNLLKNISKDPVRESIANVLKLAQILKNQSNLTANSLKNFLNDIKQGINTDDIKKLLTIFSDSKVKLQFEDIRALLEKLPDKQSFDNIKDLLSFLTNKGYLDENCIHTLLKIYDGSVISSEEIEKDIFSFLTKNEYLDKECINILIGKYSNYHWSLNTVERFLKCLLNLKVQTIDSTHIESLLNKLDDVDYKVLSASTIELFLNLLLKFNATLLNDSSIGILLNKLPDNDCKIDNIINLFNKLAQILKWSKSKLKRDYVTVLLKKIKSGQQPNDIKKLRQCLSNLNIRLLPDDEKIIFEKIDGKIIDDLIQPKLDKGKNRQDAKTWRELISELLMEYTYVDLDKYIGTILDNLANTKSASDIAPLIDILTHNGVVLTKGHIETILKQITKDSQDMKSMQNFIIALYKNANYKDEVIKSIFSQIPSKISAQDLDPVIDFIKTLKKSNIYVPSAALFPLLGKIKAKQDIENIGELIQELAENIKTTVNPERCLKIILSKLGEGQDCIKITNLIKLLKGIKGIGFTDKNLEVLLSKMRVNDIDQLVKFIKELTDMNIKLNDKHVKTMLSKFSNDQLAEDKNFTPLLNELNKNNENLNLNLDSVRKILNDELMKRKENQEKKVNNNVLNNKPKAENDNKNNNKPIELIKKENNKINNDKKINNGTNNINNGNINDNNKNLINNNSVLNNEPEGKNNNNNENKLSDVHNQTEIINNNNNIIKNVIEVTKKDINNKNMNGNNENLNYNEKKEDDNNNLIDTGNGKINTDNKAKFQCLFTLLESSNYNEYIGENGKQLEIKEGFQKCLVDKLTARSEDLAEAYENKNETWQSFEDKLNKEKGFWQGIGNELEKTGLLGENKAKEFKNEIEDIYDLNGFVTALHWIGCVLGSLVTVGVILFWDKVRNRISHPEITRQYYRFQDNKNELLSKIAPLQDNNPKIENDIEP